MNNRGKWEVLCDAEGRSLVNVGLEQSRAGGHAMGPGGRAMQSGGPIGGQ